MAMNIEPARAENYCNLNYLSALDFIQNQELDSPYGSEMEVVVGLKSCLILHCSHG